MPDRVLDAAASAQPGAALQARALVVTNFSVVLSLGFCHLLNDTVQSLVPALYPILKTSYGLSFTQVGLITLAFQFTASMLQPVVGMYTDRRPQPYSLTVGISTPCWGSFARQRQLGVHRGREAACSISLKDVDESLDGFAWDIGPKGRDVQAPGIPERNRETRRARAR